MIVNIWHGVDPEAEKEKRREERRRKKKEEKRRLRKEEERKRAEEEATRLAAEKAALEADEVDDYEDDFEVYILNSKNDLTDFCHVSQLPQTVLINAIPDCSSNPDCS